MKKPANRLLFAFAATLILSAAPAIALSQGSPQQQNAGQATNQKFDGQTLQKYAAAAVELGRIQDELGQKLEGIQDSKKALAIEQEAAQKKISAIEEQGLDILTYDKIANQAHVDPQLRKQIEQIIETRIN